MTMMWHDATNWADRLRPSVELDVSDVEQEVLDRAPYILYRHERLQGFWSLCMPLSVGNQIVLTLSVVAPLLGVLPLLGGIEFRNIQTHAVSTDTAMRIAGTCFLIGFLCQALDVAGWLRMGRRTQEGSLMMSGILLVSSGLALGAGAAIHKAVPTDINLWPAWASLIAAVAASASFRLGGSDRQLPPVDVSQLTDSERQVLLDQRNAALKTAAKRKVVKLRKVNKAVDKPLGSLIARRNG